MADNYDIITQTQTVQVLGDGTVQDIMDISMVTKPSRVAMGFYLPLQLWGDPTGNLILADNAAAVETARNLSGVEGMTVNEDVTVEGFLQHFATLYVSSTSGNSVAQLTVRLDELFAADFPQQVSDLVSKLNATETG